MLSFSPLSLYTGKVPVLGALTAIGGCTVALAGTGALGWEGTAEVYRVSGM